MDDTFDLDFTAGRLGIQQLADTAVSVHEEWDAAWPDIRGRVEDDGGAIRCREGCDQCCFSRKFCSLSEGAAILTHLRGQVPPDQQELYRMRVESAASSLNRLRGLGHCATDEQFFECGGVECPFLHQGRCAIYPVRPLACRAAWATNDAEPSGCRKCPQLVQASEAEATREKLAAKLLDRERDLGAPTIELDDPPPMIPEVLSYLWESDRSPPTTLLSPRAWELRLASRSGSKDDTWQDDRHDFQAIGASLTIPREGDYPPDLTLLSRHQDTHEVYGDYVSGDGIPDFCSLYKRDPDCIFDWNNRKFVVPGGTSRKMPHTIWMSDGLQERLMMWEAAKRCRGRVLCGGMGLGVFPQYALALPQVESVEVVEIDEAVITMIKATWSERPWPGVDRCEITSMAVEAFLRKTSEKFDTVYIDTWDAIYHEYLPHLNWLTKLAERVIEPGGEILLWAYDLMVRQFLQTSVLVLERRQKYLDASPPQLRNMARQYPMLHRLVEWLHRHPDCGEDELKTEACRIATKERKKLGLLKLSEQAGGQDLVQRKYIEGKPL